MKKKIFIISLILFVIVQVKNISYGICEEKGIDQLIIVNPNYSQIITEDNVKEMIQDDKKEKNEENRGIFSYHAIQLNSSYKGNIYYDNKIDAAQEVKNKMKNRQNNVTIRIVTKESDLKKVITSIVNLAVSEDLAENSDEGDYLAWSYGGYTVGDGSGYHYSDGKYYWLLKYTFTYYTTLEQEQILNKKIQKFIKNINIEKESKYSIIKQVNDYICKNVEYDYEHLSDSSYKLQFTAYAGLIKNKAVCQGYATLLYKILKECKVDNRVIVSKNHSWNIVNIGNWYYNVDTVWNDQLKSDKYFLNGSSDFIQNEEHIRNKEYTTNYFNSKYPTSLTKFEVNLEKIDNLKVIQTNSSEILFGWDIQDNITGYKIYKYNYYKSSWEYYKQIKGYKNNECKIVNLEPGEICKVRVRAYTMVNEDKVYGEYSENKKTITAPESISIKKIKSNKNKQIEIRWGKNLKSSGYQLQYSTDNKFKENVTTIKIKGKYNNCIKLKKLKKEEKYYIRIRPYKWYKAQKYYGHWSEIKSIKSK